MVIREGVVRKEREKKGRGGGGDLFAASGKYFIEKESDDVKILCQRAWLFAHVYCIYIFRDVCAWCVYTCVRTYLRVSMRVALCCGHIQMYVCMHGYMDV
jgi:hypothetical protein